MGALDGRVAIITGGGRGLGREHALLFAREGASVVINDLGGANDGSGSDQTAAEAVAEEIRAMGGHAVANGASVTDYAAAKSMVDQAVEVFGDLHIVVNNAGILRDRTLVNMTEEEFDQVVAVHMKGTFALSHHAAVYWKDQAKAKGEAGEALPDRAIVNTSSGAGLHGNPGQTNYGAAKAGIAAMTQIAAKELRKLGVRANAIAPIARTRLTLATPGMGDALAAPKDEEAFDIWDPANISPLVAYLSTAGCPYTGQVFSVLGGQVGLYQGWSIGDTVEQGERWTVEGLAKAMDALPRSIPVKDQFSGLGG